MSNSMQPRSSGPAPTRVLIVDDHDIARAGLCNMLLNVPGIEIIGEAADGEQALALCREKRPNLVLMDVRMPGQDGLTTTALLKREFPRMVVVIITMHDTPEYMLMALRAGAAGYLLKDTKRPQLIAAIRQVARGESFLNDEMVTRVLQQMSGAATAQLEFPVERLSVRELEVLRLMAQGKTNKGIAEVLMISPGTVKVHVERVIAKLQASDRTQAVVRALEIGILQLPKQP